MIRTRHGRNLLSWITWLNFHDQEMVLLLDQRERQWRSQRGFAWKDSFIYPFLFHSDCSKMKLLIIKVTCLIFYAQLCPTFWDPMDYIAYQSPPSMGFSRQEY